MNNTTTILETIREYQKAGDKVVSLSGQLAKDVQESPGDTVHALTMAINEDDDGNPARKRALLDALADDEGENMRLSIQHRYTKTGAERKVKGTVVAASDCFVLFIKPEKEEADKADPFEKLLQQAQKLADEGDDRALTLLEAYAAAVEG